MKINWFSPLPPGATAIGNFTERILGSLQQHFQLTLWTDVDGVAEGSYPGVKVRHIKDIDRAWPEINFADHSIFNIGNDARFHARYAELLERHSGVVILHDFNLHELHRERLIHGPNGRQAFHQFVRESEGEEALQAVRAFEQGRIQFEEVVEQVPLAGRVCQRATAIVSFNPSMGAALREVTRAPCLLCPLPLDGLDQLPGLKERPVPVNSRIELVMFGYLNSPNRCLHQVLDAIAGFGPEAVRLTLFGHIADTADFSAQVKQRGIEDRVRYLGYISEEEMASVLCASHLAINLRNPSRGESSDTLLRAWKYGLPIVVSNLAYYATLPNETVLKVQPGEEVEGLRRHISEYRSDPERMLKSGIEGHHYLRREHTADAFAERLARFLEGLHPYQLRHFTPLYGRRLGAFLERDFPDSPDLPRMKRRLASELAEWIR
jgi:glycosyltransferase involved in cell wall biosynthesis